MPKNDKPRPRRSIRRRRALKFLVVSAASTCAWPLVAQSMRESPSLSVLFTGDFHGHVEPWLGWEGNLAGKTIGGLDRVAGVVNQVRRELGPERVLLLDAGDAIGDTMLAAHTQGRAIIDLMNRVGYDAMTIGNHEPDHSASVLQERMKEARFPVLAANVEKESGEPFAPPHILRQIGGVTVGLLGLGYPNTGLTTAKKNVQGMVFKDPVDTAAEHVPRLRRAGAQLVIALTHYGLGADLKLAEQVPGIDLIIGGHSHNRTSEPLRVGQTLVLHAGAHGSDVGRIDLYFQQGRLVNHTAKLILLDHATIPSDANLRHEVERHLDPLRDRMNERIAVAAEFLIRAQTIGGPTPEKRNRESPVDSLFADVLRDETGSEIAFLPGVGYGVAIPAGPITAGQLRNLIPHESKVVTMTLTGVQVREVLEQAVQNSNTDDPKLKVGGMVQVSGLSFRYRAQAPVGMQVIEVSLGGTPLTPDRVYRVATNSMLAQGGHRYRAFKEGKAAREHTGQYEMVAGWMRRVGTVKPPAPGRIRT